MKPLKSLVPLAKWLLRIAVLAIVYQKYFDTAISFKFNNLSYFVSLLMVVFAALLFVGGFLKKPALTVVSGLIIFIVSLVVLFGLTGFNLNSILKIFPLAALGFYFLARGNMG